MGCGCNNTWFLLIILILFCCGDCGSTFSNNGCGCARTNDCGCGCGC
ncbi:MAG: hypothetical protein J6A60_04125 [Clostridia bacterium]|nr:hypothetical protein [Clostridia bacterium]